MNSLFSTRIYLSIIFALSLFFSSCNFVIGILTDVIISEAKDANQVPEPESTIDSDNICLNFDYTSLDHCQIENEISSTHKIRVEKESLIIENFNKDLPLEFEIDCEDFYENLPVYFTVHSQFEFSLKYAATKSLGYVFENEGFRYTFNIDRSGRYALKMYDIDSSRTSTIASGVYGLVKNPINFMFEVDGAHVDILINNESIHQFSYSGFEWKKFLYFVDSEMIGKYNYYKIVNDIFPNKSI